MKETKGTKTAKTVVVKKASKKTGTASTRHQRNMVRTARALKGAELKAFVAANREHLRVVAAETNRRTLSAEASKLLGSK